VTDQREILFLQEKIIAEITLGIITRRISDKQKEQRRTTNINGKEHKRSGWQNVLPAQSGGDVPNACPGFKLTRRVGNVDVAIMLANLTER
jgi:hypothetical protein